VFAAAETKGKRKISMSNIDDNNEQIDLQWDSKEWENAIIEAASELDMSEFSKDYPKLNIKWPPRIPAQDVDFLEALIAIKTNRGLQRLYRRWNKGKITRDKSAGNLEA